MIENLRLKIFVILTGVIGLVACEPDRTCRQEVNINAGLVLKCTHYDTLDVASTIVQWDSITVQGLENDSTLYDNKKNVKQVYLPLRGDTTVTVFELTWQGKKETLYIQHSNTQQFVSMACGCVIYHQIEKVWCDKVWADSVEIVNAAVEAVKQDNIRIFATTRDEKP